MRLHIPLALRWGDIDAYAHVNNAAMLGLLEEARIQALRSTLGEFSGRPGSATLTIVGHQEVEYLRPIPYDERPLECELWVARLGGASLDIGYEVYSPTGADPRELTTRAATTVVLVDAATQQPRRITEAERTAWEPYLEGPVAFTKRR